MTKDQHLVKDWNKLYPIGTDVVVNKGGTDERTKLVRTKTKSEAETLGGDKGNAVVWLEDISGCYCLTHVMPVPLQENQCELYAIRDIRTKMYYCEDGEAVVWYEKPLDLIKDKEKAQDVIDYLVDECMYEQENFKLCSFSVTPIE